MLAEIINSNFNRYASGAEKDLFFETRKQAFEAFETMGFPTQKNEEWKYTNIKGVTAGSFEMSDERPAHAKTIFEKSVLNEIKANQLIFVNGIFYPDLSILLEKDKSIVLTNLANARTEYSELFNRHFSKYAKTEEHSLNALNTALLNDGAFIYVPEGVKPEYPVIINHYIDSTHINVLVQPRNLMVIDKGAEITLIETYESIGFNASYTNVVSEIYVAENAHLEHYKVQQQAGESYHTNFTQMFQESNTSINQVTLTLDGKLVRNNLHFYMNGKNCNSLLYGLYIIEKQNTVDNHTRVDHAQPNCFSDEKYKGILKDQSTAIFNGKIIVHLDAQKTNAYQRNQNVLLSDEAVVNTKPQLEIFADDVKCTHGATIGQLDEEPMFYLRSRGIPENEARKMLLNAFADEIAERIKIPELVELLEKKIEEKL
ncbi:MAG: Fe-S cluster assembly protein SufD [Bacteroidota bacterium]|nr:Fe-S cluster assembly protein SufD [Bacteroidota bacterium]